MSERVVLESRGLVLAPGELSRAGGSLSVASNVNAEAPGVIRSRNGHAREATGVGGPGWKMYSDKELGVGLLYNYGSNLVATALKYGNGTDGWTTVSGTFTNQPATRMQTAVSRRNHYVTTDEGVRRIETDFTATMAGMPKALALDLAGVTVLTGAPGVVLADTESVAYRVTWSRKDAQGIPMEGSPSSRTVVYNNTRTSGYSAGVVKNIVCRVVIPKQALTSATALTAEDYFRIYRSPVAATGIEPSDEMQLVYEANLTAGDITAGYVDVTDATPEAFRILGPALYTNANLGGDNGVGGPGLDQSNDPPPRARDVALFSECLFYSDIEYPHALDLNLLSTVAGTGITAADTLTLGGITYTAIAPGAPANNEFQVFTTAGGSSASEALERTAIDLCRCINGSTTNTTLWAYYISNPEGLPGLFRLESRTNGPSFTAVASAHGTAFRPSLAAAVSSAADAFPNGFAYSRPVAGDAVPRVNLGRLGRDDVSLLCSRPLGESLFQFTDAGIYRLTGDSAPFSVQEFDLTFRLIGRELVVACDDALYAWGYQGIAKITQSGVEYISNAIEPKLLDIINTQSAITASDPAQSAYTRLATYGFAIAYQGRHKVIFNYPVSVTGGNARNCAAALVYDTRMETWTTWSYSRAGDSDQTQGYSTGCARAFDDILYFGQWLNAGGDTDTYRERRTFTAADYADDNYDQTGQGIVKTLTWNVQTTSPALMTHWDELHVFFDVSSLFNGWTTPTALTATYTADFASGSGANSIAPTATSRMSRQLVPRGQRRSARLSVTLIHSVVSEYFGIEGLAFVHAPGESTATVRT